MPTTLPPPLPSREHPRARADIPVGIQVEGQTIPARARNLSMVGLYLDAHFQTPEFFGLRIPLPGLPREIVATARVERRDQRGVAVSFADIDWDDLLLVARWLAPRI